MKEIKINPIVKKDIRVSSRSAKLSVSLLIFEAILTITLLIIFGVISVAYSSIYSSENIYYYTTFIFPILASIELAIVIFIIPIISSSSISGEIERQTFDIMLTTSLTPIKIVLGKVFSSMMRILLYIVASIPILSLSFIVGGTPWYILLLYILFVMFISFLASSIGVFCSAIAKRSIIATISSFIIYIILGVTTFIPLIIDSIFYFENDNAVLPLLFNPLVLCEEFISLTVSNEAIFDAIGTAPAVDGHQGTLLHLLCNNLNWFFASTILLIFLAFIFIFLAAKKIDPLNDRNNKKSKVKKQY